jgi:plastocyanin
MKKFYLLSSVFTFISICAFSAQFNVTTPGTFYSPGTTNAAVGDTINFSASSFHPCVQVSQTTWTNNQNTPLAGGWGVMTSNFSHVITSAGTIYFVCQNHVFSGMKGQIVATASNIAKPIAADNIKLLSNSINQKDVTVLNSTGLHGKMEVFDLSGKLAAVHELSAEARQQIQMDLPKGIFLYRFNMEGTITSTERLYVGADLH